MSGSPNLARGRKPHESGNRMNEPKLGPIRMPLYINTYTCVYRKKTMNARVHTQKLTSYSLPTMTQGPAGVPPPTDPTPHPENQAGNMKAFVQHPHKHQNLATSMHVPLWDLRVFQCLKITELNLIKSLSILTF